MQNHHKDNVIRLLATINQSNTDQLDWFDSSVPNLNQSAAPVLRNLKNDLLELMRGVSYDRLGDHLFWLDSNRLVLPSRKNSYHSRIVQSSRYFWSSQTPEIIQVNCPLDSVQLITYQLNSFKRPVNWSLFCSQTNKKNLFSRLLWCLGTFVYRPTYAYISLGFVFAPSAIYSID